MQEAVLSGVNGQPSVVWQTSMIAGNKPQEPLVPNPRSATATSTE